MQQEQLSGFCMFAILLFSVGIVVILYDLNTWPRKNYFSREQLHIILCSSSTVAGVLGTLYFFYRR